MTLRFGSVCSGIEAASVAWAPLGWQAAWFSEIEPFPSAVLAHHHPNVPNLGSMVTLPERVLAGEVEAPDLLCGGTPCQAFSVAGLRRSLDDARGNLSLNFCELADAIDTVRSTRGDEPAIVFWENVPGVLSTADNAFGCFLGRLAGSGCELQPPGRRWSDAGRVLGPARAVAWRILDAQYFGLAQRRRRVFVVASARKDLDPAAVLFEQGGVRRDSAPSRQARQDATASVASGARVSSVEVAPTLDQRAGRSGETTFATSGGLVAEFVGRTMLGHDVFPCLDRTSYEKGWCNQAIQQGLGVFCMSSGQANAEVARDHAPTLNCLHEAPALAQSMTVRRLTPRECERLQGFPDDYTAIRWRGRPAEDCPDGPRYKALGNSWAVPVVRWIGARIQQEVSK